ETTPLKGAYLADTLYLPEKVQLSGHTLILANYVVFEGKNPVIKGNFDLHFFPTKPVIVLDTTLAEVLHRKGRLENVKFGVNAVLPSFSVIQDLVKTTPHTITFDTSGREAGRAQKPRIQIARPRTASWSGGGLFQSGDQNTSGQNGSPGSAGFSPSPAADGASPGKSPDGDCSDPSVG